MKKALIIIAIVIVALLIIGFVFVLLTGDIVEEVLFDKEAQVTMNDDFTGPRNGSEHIERDGIFNSLIIHPTNPDIVYVGTETNGLFKSIDGGTNWQWLRTGLLHNYRGFPEAYDMQININNPNTLYTVFTNGPAPADVSPGAGFYISNNAGETWEQRINGLPNTGTNSIGIAYGETDRIIISADGHDSTNYRIKEAPPGGIFYSDDQGNNWQAATLPTNGEENKYMRMITRGDIVYTCGVRNAEERIGDNPLMFDYEKSIGLLRSTDRGSTWEIAHAGICFYFDVSADGNIIYHNDDQGNLYGSTDAGEIWEQINSPSSNTLKISPHDSDFILFAVGGSLFKTTDGFISSKRVFDLNARNIGFDDIEFTSDPNTIYAGGDGYRIYKSLDAGESWSEISNLRNYIDIYE